MRHVDFDPDRLTGAEKDFWAAWQRKSEKASRQAREQHARGEKITTNDDVWKELKEWLLKAVFHGKCAYCEGKYTAGTYDAAEHWRPKAKVTDIEGEVVRDANGAPHPGYWWLAYEWRNLVPACDRCNSGQGKMNKFPVRRQHVFAPLTDIEAMNTEEDPLLLHPYESGGDTPEAHLEFGLFGHVTARNSSERGMATIKVCNLKRKILEDDRAERQSEAEDSFIRALGELIRHGTPLERSMAKWTGPAARYSESVKAYVTLNKKKWGQVLLSGG